MWYKLNLLCGFQSTNSDRFSGDSYEGPPVPISNTVVKLVNAESTWLVTAWEDRKSLIKQKRKVYRKVGLFLFASLKLAIYWEPSPANFVGVLFVLVDVGTAWET